MGTSADHLDPQVHDRIFHEKVVAESELDKLISHERPMAIILGGQPGAGKGGLKGAARAELHGDVATIDPDELREFHPRVKEFRAANSYSWSDRTHDDASAWATELREAAVAGRKNVMPTSVAGP